MRGLYINSTVHPRELAQPRSTAARRDLQTANGLFSDYHLLKSGRSGLYKLGGVLKFSLSGLWAMEAGGSSDHFMCVVCLEEVDDTSPVLRCGHTFHTQCISSWGERSKTCPTCRMSTAVRVKHPLLSTRLLFSLEAWKMLHRHDRTEFYCTLLEFVSMVSILSLLRLFPRPL